ncbi:MAG: TrkA family potassium uptake protein [Lachnospiraceae bacterium]|nr:TrkA family potassium uptake protein [Lachnospiraceae bacterium]
MKSVLLIGAGRFGQCIAKKMYDENYQLMVVDKNEEKVNAILPYCTSARIGDSTSEEFLAGLGIRHYDVCIVAIGDDFQNSLETTSLLKEMGARRVVAQASRDRQEKYLLNNGADEVIYLDKLGASLLAIRCFSDFIQDCIDLDSSYSIMELQIPASFSGKTVLQSNVRTRHGINILGIRNNESWDMNITPDTILPENGSLLVLGTKKAIIKCFHI